MIGLLYRFSKVAGLTCKLDNSVINCGSFPVNFFLIFRITIFGKPVNKCFWANRRGRLEVFWKKAIQNLLRKFSVKPIFSLVANFQPLACTFTQKLSPPQIYSSEFSRNIQNNHFIEHFQTAGWLALNKRNKNNLNFEPCLFCCQTAGVVLWSSSLFLKSGLLEGSYEFGSVCSSVRP